MSKIRKALAAGVAAGLAVVAQAAATDGLAHINWGVVAGAVVVAGYGVFKIKNAPAA
jgi:hypothetical protein